MALNRKYDRIDLLRFHKLANENPTLFPLGWLKLYDETFPELSSKEKYENIINAVDIEFPEIKKEPKKKKCALGRSDFNCDMANTASYNPCNNCVNFREI